ncbi:MAG TPA: hypothetical protein GXZ90_00475 [Clostridiales bacterium]|nr:hypothetical protein [Clostridiales bacterium]
MKILLCYSSNNLSNAIASAAIARCEKEDPKDFIIERFNLDKRSIRKYFNNDDIENKANIVYVFNDDLHRKHWDTFNLLQRQFKNLKIITYNKNLIYTPARVPGNTLKTKVHYLYDKIMYDMEVNFEQIPMYRVARSVNEIDMVHLHGFEANSPYAKRFMTEAHNCYHTKRGAREHLKERVYKSLDIKQKEIKRFEKRVRVLKDEMKMLQEEYHRVSVL